MRRWFTVTMVSVLLTLGAVSRSQADGQGAVAVPSQVPPSVSLVEAVRQALTNAREIRLAAQDTRIAAQGKTRAEAGRLPRLDVGADYTALSEPPSAFINGVPLQTADQSIFRARVTVEQTIYDFGRTSSRVRQADARLSSSGLVEGFTREREALDVISAFLSAKRAEEIRAVARESLETARAHRKVAGDLYDGGVVARNDVLAADVQAANAEAALISAENQVELSRSRLALRMGYSGDLSIAPASGDFPAPTEPASPLEESVRTAREKRSELKVQGSFIREGEAAVDSTRSEFAPVFFGQGGFSHESNQLNPHQDVFSLVVGGKLNLFSGFSDAAANRQALLSVERSREALAQARDSIALEVKAAHLSVAEAGKKLQVTGVAVSRAEENLRIQDDRYREGLSISTEALDAQTLLTRAKVDQRNAAYDLHEARYRLLYARGELLEFLTPLLGTAR